MALTRQQKEDILALDERELSAMVEAVVFDRPSCLCPHGTPGITDQGLCIHCSGHIPAQWAESDTASRFLRGTVRNWSAWNRDRFLDHLGWCVSARIGQGAVQPRLWILYATTEDICRAAILAKLEEG